MQQKKTKPSILELNIQDFRAIKEANIKLDGITVVTGENGCGKSTLSKLLYYTIKISKLYDDFLKDDWELNLLTLTNLLKNLSKDNSKIGNYQSYYEYLKQILKKTEIDPDIKSILHKNIIIFKIKEYVKYLVKNSQKIDLKAFYRFNHIFLEDFHEYTKELKNKNDQLKLEELPEVIENVLERIYKKTEKKINERNKKLFEIKFKNIYHENLKNFSIYEYSVPIINHESQRIDKFQSVEHIIYIDSPMVVENEEYKFWKEKYLKINKFSHWDDLDFYLKNLNKREIEKMREGEIHQEIKELFTSPEILNGEINLNDDELIFNRNDGKSFKVLDCATGVKSIAILQMLHKNGWLTNKTLLILDEPETHLHPQWVVEYARLVVLLNKEIGVKFFISSHHPDMISAIQDITNKEKTNNKLRFYLGEKQENSQYSFIDKGIDEEDIFDSFNKSMDKIALYGEED